MLDIKFIRQNSEIVQSIAEQKGIVVSISELLRWDESRRKSLKDAEELRQMRNQQSQYINELLQQGNTTESDRVKEKVKQINIQLSEVEADLSSRDVRGLYRVHQFSKVEQVVLCANDTAVSDNIFREIMQNAEDILQLLELPYRIMSVCSGDMSQKTYKQHDIEVWMPSRQAYGETHSSSNIQDFQARRSNIRYRDASGALQYCHTLNNTAIASPRILIPLLENHQNEDGSIRIPEALRKYMNGLEIINMEAGI